jgi:ParB family chromosome partitioning protein
MKKLDELRRTLGANAADSLARGQAPAAEQEQAIEMPERLRGLAKSRNAAEIALDRIVPDPDQPREAFDEDAIDRLAGSLGARGVLQPLRVRWSEEKARYVLIAGERRWRAAARAGLTSVPCVIHEGSVDHHELLALQLIENCLREDLQPIEQARGFRKLMDAQGWSARELARELNLPPSTVARALELLDLPKPVQELVDRGALAPSAACEVGRLERPEEQVALAEQAVSERLTRDQVVAAVKSRKVGRAAPPRTTRAEIRLEDGFRITITGEGADGGRGVVIEVLRRAIRKLQAEERAAQKDEAA